MLQQMPAIPAVPNMAQDFTYSAFHIDFRDFYQESRLHSCGGKNFPTQKKIRKGILGDGTCHYPSLPVIPPEVKFLVLQFFKFLRRNRNPSGPVEASSSLSGIISFTRNLIPAQALPANEVSVTGVFIHGALNGFPWLHAIIHRCSVELVFMKGASAHRTSHEARMVRTRWILSRNLSETVVCRIFCPSFGRGATGPFVIYSSQPSWMGGIHERATFKKPARILSIKSWLFKNGILIMAYYNPHITG